MNSVAMCLLHVLQMGRSRDSGAALTCTDRGNDGIGINSDDRSFDEEPFVGPSLFKAGLEDEPTSDVVEERPFFCAELEVRGRSSSSSLFPYATRPDSHSFSFRSRRTLRNISAHRSCRLREATSSSMLD